ARRMSGGRGAGDGHRLGVAAGVEKGAGRGAGERAFVDDADAVDVDGFDAGGFGVEAAGAGGEVGSRALLVVADFVGVEEDEVGGPAFGYAAAVAEAVEAGGDVGELVDRLFEGDYLLLADAVGEEGGRADGAAHHVEVGAGVGAPDDRSGVTPHFRSQLPVLRRRFHAAGGQAGPQLV